MNRQLLRELRDAQLAQARSWLEGETARAAWMEAAQGAVDALLDAPVERILDAETTEALVDALLSRATVTQTVRPLAVAIARTFTAHARSVDSTVAALLSDETRGAIDVLAARSDLVDPEVLRRIVQDPGLEAIMRDVLFDALTAFNERTNPFVASWGVPALLDAIPVIGRSAVRRTFDSVRAEFDRRLEPEMRKFLAGFAKKSLEDSVATAMRKAAEPEMIAWRKHVAAVLIDRRVAEALWSLDDARGKALIATLEGALYDVMTHATTRQLVLEALRETSRQTAGQSLRAIAARHGVAIPNLEPAFAAAWPAAQRALGAEGVLSALGRFIDATHEAWLAARSES